MLRNIASLALGAASVLAQTGTKTLIRALPEGIQFDTNVWNGYLPVTDTKKLHYMLVESQDKPD